MNSLLKQFVTKVYFAYNVMIVTSFLPFAKIFKMWIKLISNSLRNWAFGTGIVISGFFVFNLFLYFSIRECKWCTINRTKYGHIKNDTLQDPSFLTIYCNKGRLGNQMSTYATLLGLSNLNNRTPFPQRCNMIHLRPYFHVTATEIYELPKNLIKEYPIGRYFHPEDGHIPIDKNMLSGHKTPNSFTFYNHIRNQLKREFQFREHILSYVQTFLSSLKKFYSTAVFVGVHVRRTDYFRLLKKYGRKEVSSQYFIKAMKYFRTKYNNVIFIVVSDDRKWSKKHLGKLKDVIVAPDPPKPAYDMALLTQCNHTIIAYGSFGFWSAYLSDGETVYFAEYLSSNPTLLKNDTPYNKTYPSNWIGLKIHD